MDNLNPGLWVIVCTFVVVILEFVSILDEPRKHIWRSLIFITAVFILAFGIAVHNQQEAYQEDRITFEKQLAQKSDKIAEQATELGSKSDKIAGQAIELSAKSDRIADQATQLVAKSDKIAKQAYEIAMLSTGGDSFCYVGFLFTKGGENRPSLVVFHSGKYPLQNIHINMDDIDLLNATLPDIPKGASNARRATIEEFDGLHKFRTTFQIPTLGPASAQQLRAHWKLPDKDQITYSVQIDTQFQKFFQHIKIHKVTGNWTIAYRVIKHGPKNDVIVLREQIPSNFPRDKSGNIDWNFF